MTTLQRDFDVRSRIDTLYRIIGFEPTPDQLEILRSRFRFTQVAGGEQGGKALALDTPIPTPDGWKTMGDLEAGDLVFGDDGVPVRITWVSPVHVRPSYEVTFDTGASLIASDEHLWAVRNYSARKHGFRPKVRTTLELIEDGLVRLAPRNRRPFANWSITNPAPLQLPDRDLPIDPYVLGAWLGDGNSSGASITTMDREILTNLAWAGVAIRPTSHPMHFGMGGSPGTGTAESRAASLRPALRKLGLLGNKHIPQDYLRASYAQRLALLQGLMDTDGYIDKRGRIEFCSTRRELVDGFTELIASFGWSWRTYEKRAMLYGKDCGPVWNVRFQTRETVFRLARKAMRQKPALFSSRSDNLYIASIEPLGERKVKCISVDNDSHLYLAGHGMVPTHNSVTVSKYFLERFEESAPDGSDEYWLVGQTYDRVTREFRYLVQDLAALGILRNATKRVDPGEIVLIDGTKIVTKSADDPTSLAMVAPRGIMACEAGVMSHWVFELLEGRTAGKRAWLFMTGTFETSVGWYPMIWEQWRAGFNDRKSFSLPTWSNTHLYPGGRWDPEIVRLEREHSEEYFMERIAGVPVPPKGRVFREFSPDVHIVSHEWDPMEPVYLWEDPGYGGAATHVHALEVFQYIEGQLRGIDEIYAHGLLTEDVIDICQTKPWWKSPKVLVSDPHYKDQHHAMSSVAEQWLRQAGLVAGGKRVQILPGIERMKTLLKRDPVTGQPRIVFHPKMQGVLSEFGAAPSPVDGQSHVYSWRVTEDGQAAGQVPIDAANDGIKAIIYGAVDLLGYPTGAPRVTQAKVVKRHGTRRRTTFAERRRANR